MTPELAAAAVTALLDHIHTDLDGLTRRATELWDLGQVTGTGSFAALRPAITQLLERHPTVSGAGYIAAISVLPQPRYWEWWVQDDDGLRPLPLRQQTDTIGTYAYEDLEWYTGAAAGSPQVVGPYLDLAGADFLVITSTAPVFHDDAFVGLCGVDISFRSFETELRRVLRALDGPAVITDARDRVVASSVAGLPPGERFPGNDTGVPIDPTRTRWRLRHITPG